MLPKRAGNYYARPGISFMEIGLPPAPSALMWRRNDIRPITHDLNEILVGLARQYGTMP